MALCAVRCMCVALDFGVVKLCAADQLMSLTLKLNHTLTVYGTVRQSLGLRTLDSQTQ